MQTIYFSPMALLPAALAAVLLFLCACGGGQKAASAGSRHLLLQGELAGLAGANPDSEWEAEVSRLGLARDDHGRLLVEIRYIAGALGNVRSQLKDRGYSIQLVKQHYERLNVWISDADQLQGLTRIGDVSLVTLAPPTDLLTSITAVE
ncbi:hypothetical protein NCG89_01650 [Spongiibacter taiwanensis]|uniref:hypothetical protein n=1 Tax=Spongiibacter taiwanensis TaxID=1748242 RepID=UPI0020354B1B|nr:hypothetical protein [Spongiibacter taiwanensis]USA43504.1 hypothetical protein NCG89_01650 [Spongiibacter taiwanensis]